MKELRNILAAYTKFKAQRPGSAAFQAASNDPKPSVQEPSPGSARVASPTRTRSARTGPHYEASCGSPASSSEIALATVIHVSGSAYRRPGAKMLITSDGNSTGSVSGGCLERDVIENTLRLFSDESANCLLLEYDTNHDDDAIFGVGTGCTGSVVVFIEKLRENDPLNPLELISRSIYAEKLDTIIATIVRSHDSKLLASKVLVQQDLVQQDRVLASGNISEQLKVELCGQIRAQSQPGLLTYKEFDVYVEPLHSLPQLYIFGAGHDAVPLADLACSVGLQVTVLDHRKSFADPKRFPQECKVLHYRPEDQSTYPEINNDFCIVMAHNFSVDQQALRQLISTDATYIGVLGPKKRTDKMLSQFTADGLVLSDEQKSKIYAPIGLDLGAETPDEIALSILAEIKAVSSQRNAGFLRDRDQPIHNPSEVTWSKSSASESLVSSCDANRSACNVSEASRSIDPEQDPSEATGSAAFQAASKQP